MQLILIFKKVKNTHEKYLVEVFHVPIQSLISNHHTHTHTHTHYYFFFCSKKPLQAVPLTILAYHYLVGGIIGKYKVVLESLVPLGCKAT